MSYRSYRKDVRESLDPHLAVDPEDRFYLTADLTEEGDDFTKELRRNRRRRGGSTTRSFERGIGEALDSHLAVDPEDRIYLTADLTEEGDDFTKELRRNRRRRRGSTTRSLERGIGEALDSHLAVDPEDRPYLMDEYEDEKRRGSRPKAEKKTKESYKVRKDKEYQPSKKGAMLSGGMMDVVCIDGSDGADRALLYAARNLPKDHALLLVHGVHSWMKGSIGDEDKPDILEVEDHYERMCQKVGRDCKFKHFTYTTTSGFGDEVCRIAENKGAGSVVIGRRENISGMRRALMGSSSQSVMNNCFVPVTIVGTAINTNTKKY